MSEKIIGYLLLAIGLTVILYSAVSVYMVFTKKSEPVKLFNFSGVSIDTADLLGENMSQEQKQLAKEQLGDASVEIIPSNLLNDSSNIFAHLFLMGFVASIGYRLGMLGIYLLRPIKVNLKEAKPEPPKAPPQT